MKKTLVVCAMNEELAILKSKWDLKEYDASGPWTIYRHNDKELYAVITGVGKVFGAACLSYAIEKIKPMQIIGMGVAGGVSPDLKIGDIVICDKAIQHDMDVTAFGYPLGQVPGIESPFIKADINLVEKTEKLAKNFTNANIKTGAVMSGDCFVTGGKGLSLHDQFGGLCVDMESAAWAQVSYIFQIPFLVLRSISDQADGNAADNFTEFLSHAVNNLSDLVEKLLER
jgi:adenosylhomocysteine nucleosidase